MFLAIPLHNPCCMHVPCCDDYDDDDVNGVRIHLSAAATNGPIGHPPGKV
jgi:hypothetical protein